MWSRIRPRLDASFVSLFVNRIRYARDIHDRSIIAGARLATEGLRIPGLSFRDFRFRQEQVNMLMADRHGLGLVFQNFDAYPVRRLHEGLVQAVVVAWKHPHTCGL